MIDKKEYGKLIAEIQALHESDKHVKILRAIERIPQDQWDYHLTGFYARALNNLDKYEEALDLLLKIEDQGKEDGVWYFRVGYALYYLEREAEAAEYFQKAIDFGDDGKDTREFLARSLKEAAIKAEQAQYNPEVYEASERIRLGKHIEEYFGASKSVFHELISPDIHVDIFLIEPTPERDYYVLVTMGMGAHRMNVPQELIDDQLDRAELVICLPPDWNFKTLEKEEWYWPIRRLKMLARLPIEDDTWLGWGHTVSSGEPFAGNAPFTSILLLHPAAFGRKSFQCGMEDGSVINFYQLIPLYEEEARFKVKTDVDLLLKFFDAENLAYIHLDRENVCKA
jgi:tetratricopeptide (TPR) repeat protein